MNDIVTAAANIPAELKAKLLNSIAVPDVGDSISRITLSGGMAIINDQGAREIDLVIVASLEQRAYYQDSYDPDNIVPPHCYSYDLIHPHDDSYESQETLCEECPMNQWGSDGGGKACKQFVNLMCLPLDDLDGEFYLLKVTTTQLKSWGAYVRKLASKTVPTAAVVTTITTSQGKKYKNVTDLSFEATAPLEAEQLETVIGRLDEANDILHRPHPAWKEED